MSILDFLSNSMANLGGTIVGAAEEVSRGATFDHKTIACDGNPTRARQCLKDHGIDAWGVKYLRRRGELDVRGDDYERAKKVLRKNGFDAW